LRKVWHPSLVTDETYSKIDSIFVWLKVETKVMKKAKLKQKGLAIYLLASLFVSAVSAGICLHHPKQVETTADTSSPHQHSEEAHEQISREHHESADSSGTARSVVPSEECCCVEAARKVVAKIENLKIEKQSLAVLPAPQIAIAFVPQKLAVKTEFTAPFYLTDSFYNLSPGRAPPIL
jgi:hypothetical protein